MDRLIEQLQPLNAFLTRIQCQLDFEDWRYYPQFSTKNGLGRVAFLAAGLGIIWGIHGSVLLLLSLESWGIISLNLNLKFWSETEAATAAATTSTTDATHLYMAWQWCFYVWSLCTFHLLEFFTTAVYNPNVTSGDSFLVNHSKPYTAAFTIAASEFGLKFAFLPTSWFPYHPWVCRLGILMVLISQAIRSWAMKTCGESFNHLIQTSKKNNHNLITHGIYQYFRHPSYVGFYYWSIGTQLVLNNFVSTLLFALASLAFFRRRIPFEEESLLQHFPEEYLKYAQKTYVGIPFIPSMIPKQQEKKQS